jgi:hypothetical protein
MIRTRLRTAGSGPIAACRAPEQRTFANVLKGEKRPVTDGLHIPCVRALRRADFARNRLTDAGTRRCGV